MEQLQASESKRSGVACEAEIWPKIHGQGRGINNEVKQWKYESA